MSDGRFLFLLLVFAPIVVGACLLSLRLWKGKSVRGVDVSDLDVALLGEAAKCGSAASFPAGSFALAFGLAWAVVDYFLYPYRQEWLLFLANGLVTVSLVLLASTITLLLFMQPWFLVPPPLRGHHGFVVESWQRWRQRRQRQPSSGRRRRDVG